MSAVRSAEVARTRRAVDKAAGLGEFETALSGAPSLTSQPLSLFLEGLPWEDSGASRLRRLVDELELTLLGDLWTSAPFRRKWARRKPAERAWLLAALKVWVGAELSTATDGAGEGAPAAGSGREGVESWAKARGLSRVLVRPALVLERLLSANDRRWLWGCPPDRTVGDIFGLPTAAPGVPLDRSVPFAVRQAAAEWLHDRAAEHEAGRDHAVSFPIVPPSTDAPAGPLHSLRARWWTLWTALADELAPLAPDPGATLVLDAPNEVLTWTAGVRECGGGDGPVAVVLPLRGGGPTLRCGCSPALQRVCPQRRRGLEAALRAIDEDRQDALWRDVLDVFAAPAWERGLGELDQLLPGVDVPEDVQLGWVLDDDPSGVVRLRPATVRWREADGWKVRTISIVAALRGASGPASKADRAVLADLQLLSSHTGTPPPPLQRAIVSRCVAALPGHPRVFDGEGRRLDVLAAPLGLVIQEGSAGGAALHPTVGGTPWPASHVLGVLAENHAGDVSFTVDDGPPLRLMSVSGSSDVYAFFRALSQRGAEFPPEGVDALLERIPAFAELLPVTVSEGLAGRRVAPRSHWAVELQLLAGERVALSVRLRVLPVAGGKAQVPGRGAVRVFGCDARGRLHADRDLDEERPLCGELLDMLCLDPAGAAGDASWVLTSPDRAMDVVGRLQQLSDGPVEVEVRWRGERQEVVADLTDNDLTVNVQKGRDWFGLAGGLKVDELELALGALLDQVRTGARYVRVTGGAWVRLDEELRARLSRLADVHGTGAGGLVGLVGVLDDLEDAGATVDGVEDWRDLERQVHETLAWTPPPPGLTATLREYQRVGFVWLARLARLGSGAILADDMGLGKTLQTIALLAHLADEGPALVVAPKSLCMNWASELRRFAPSLRPRHYAGSGRRAALAGLRAGDVVIVSYGLAVREAGDSGDLGRVDFSTLVLDEAQAVKNPETQRHQALQGLSRRRAVLLTGTPVENREDELWALMAFANPAALGSRSRFMTLLEGDASTEGSTVAVGRGRVGAVVSPFVLRRRKSEVARELPPRTIQTERVLPPVGERERYGRARAAVVARLRQSHAAGGQEQGRFEVLAALTRLRQLACHPGLIDPTWMGGSAKLRRVVEIVEESVASGHRLLLFSQFTRFLGMVRDQLAHVGQPVAWLDGSMSTAARERAVQSFQSGEHPVFLLSLLAGGTGLNLTAADRVLLLDPWWNPAAEAQAADRAHRIGQQRAVHIIRLVTAGTIEERVHELQDDKRKMVGELLGGQTGGASALARGGGDPTALVHALLGDFSGGLDESADSSEPA